MFTAFVGNPLRTETLRINFELNKQHADRHRESIVTILRATDKRGMPDIREGDTFKLNYQFCIDYFGSIANVLTAVCNLLDDPELVADVELHELEHGESLIVSVLDKLREAQAIIARRNGI